MSCLTGEVDLPRALNYYQLAVRGVQRCKVDDPELATSWHERLKRAKNM